MLFNNNIINSKKIIIYILIIFGYFINLILTFGIAVFNNRATEIHRNFFSLDEP